MKNPYQYGSRRQWPRTNHTSITNRKYKNKMIYTKIQQWILQYQVWRMICTSNMATNQTPNTVHITNKRLGWAEKTLSWWQARNCWWMSHQVKSAHYRCGGVKPDWGKERAWYVQLYNVRAIISFQTSLYYLKASLWCGKSCFNNALPTS